MGDVVVRASVAQCVAETLLTSWGAPPEVAVQVAEHLVLADLSGHSSHGVSRLPWYRRYVDDGVVLPGASPEVVADSVSRDAVVVVSANWGFSQPAGNLAVDLAVERALAHGVGAAAAIRCTHMGRMGTFVERAARQGCAAIVTVGGMRGAGVTVPFGGATPLLGPSPFAMGFPTGQRSPVMMDISTTEVPLGKVLIAKNSGKRLSVPGLVEADGSLTDDPFALDRGGALATFGGHKGFGLATLADLFGGVLTGGFTVRDEGPGGPSFRSAGLLVITLAVDAFAPSSDVMGEAAALQGQIRSVPPAPGFDSVLAPGDPEDQARASAQGDIRVPKALWDQITNMAETIGAAMPPNREVVR